MFLPLHDSYSCIIVRVKRLLNTVVQEILTVTNSPPFQLFSVLSFTLRTLSHERFRAHIPLRSVLTFNVTFNTMVCTRSTYAGASKDTTVLSVARVLAVH